MPVLPSAYAQETAPPPDNDPVAVSTPDKSAPVTAALYLRFVNSQTGTGVAPTAITMDGKPLKFNVEAGSLVSVSLASGVHSFTFEAEGFAPMTVSLSVDSALTPVTEIEMDPVTESEEAAVSPDAALLEGTVSDADTATAISGAKISISGSDLTTSTASDGSYRLEVITGPVRGDTRPAVTMDVRAEGYVSARLKNIAVDPGGRTRVPVRLSRQTTATAESAVEESDEGFVPGGNFAQGWTFDVSRP